MKNNDISTGETPITRLSKIFSRTSFCERMRVDQCNETVAHTRTGIPPDIDESANQEPPTHSNSWAESLGFPRESSNSCSSGYCSNITSRSAPPSCDSEKIFVNNALKCQTFSNVDPNGVTSPTTDIKLRRTKSCTNPSWLLKRNRTPQWPKISGISRTNSRDTSMSSTVESNSCPAAIVQSLNFQSSVSRYSLPPVGELASTSTSEATSSPNKAIMNFSSSSDGSIKSPTSSLDYSFRPVSKRARINSPVKTDIVEESTGRSLNNTVLIEDIPNINLDADQQYVQHPIPQLFRHHSTPMPTSYYAAKCHSSPIEEHAHVSRSLSDPPSIVCDKLARSIGMLDSQSLCVDDKKVRALNVVDRTTSGLHCVTIDTVAELVKGPAKNKMKFVIVDCRFPYEYEGGHIRGAINIFTHSDLVQEIFNRVPAQRPPGVSGPPRLLGEWLTRRLAITHREPLSAPCELISDDSDDDAYVDGDANVTSDLETSNNQSATLEQIQHSKSESDLTDLSTNTSNSTDSVSHESPFIVIFHCEFSSQRAPALATFLRTLDRASNYHRYPFLYFPEIYVMKGGYSAFYSKFPHMCTPKAYVKMFHRDYRNHLRLYKRLTRRVSSACLACVKPQLSELGSFKPSIPVTSNGCNLSLNSPLMDSLLCARPALKSSVLMSVADTRAHVDTEEKENCKPEANIDCDPVTMDNTRDFQSPKCSNRTELNTSLSDSPLNLAEVVVRIGRRVIATTLCKSDPATSEVARVLDQVKQRALTKALEPSAKPAVGLLKRSLTTTALEYKQKPPIIPYNELNFSMEGNCFSQTPECARRHINCQNPETPLVTKHISKPKLTKSRSGIVQCTCHSLSSSSNS